MAHKVNPKGFRIGLNKTWTSHWFGSGRDFAKRLEADIKIREYVARRWKDASIAEVAVERSQNFVRIIVKTSRPGILIGRGGSGVEDMTIDIRKRFFSGKKDAVKVDVQEVRNYEESATLLAQNVAEQLEKRMPFRRVLKSALEQTEKNKRIKGAKIEISGRLGGVEMSRKEWLSKGNIPLHTLRADIDYAQVTAHTTYGIIGVKAWVYKGEVIPERGGSK